MTPRRSPIAIALGLPLLAAALGLAAIWLITPPPILRGVLWTLYGLTAFVSLGNLLLMARPKASDDGPEIHFLVPARDEAENLAELLPLLTPQGPVTVFDDESADRTAEVAREFGARVLTPKEPLPSGWTGKNRACHELALSVVGNPVDESYVCFLDADVRVSPDFAARLRATARPDRVTTAFPTIVHGAFPEPLVLGWVGWSLLAFNPFFLVGITGKGHNRFTNGQIALWPAALYRRLRPNEAVRDRILEDVLIGRLLARAGIPVLTANLSSSMRVAMYRTWRQAFDGMSKNSYEITGNRWGNAALAALLLLIGWGWLLLGWPGYALLLTSALASAATVRGNLVHAPLFPLSLTIGAIVLLRSHLWRLTGRTQWKGRVYP